MTQYEFNKLRIEKNNIYGVKISLDDLELRGVKKYQITSSEHGRAELVIELTVGINEIEI